MPVCKPDQMECAQKALSNSSCPKLDHLCTGLYADVTHEKAYSNPQRNTIGVEKLMEEYHRYVNREIEIEEEASASNSESAGDIGVESVHVPGLYYYA